MTTLKCFPKCGVNASYPLACNSVTALGIANVFNSILQFVALSSAVGAVFASAPSQLPGVENPIPVCDPTVPRERTLLSTAIVDAFAGSSASGAMYEHGHSLLVIAKGVVSTLLGPKSST
jgi:hypothetical protein